MGEGGDKQTSTQTHTQTDTHINTMTRPGLGAGPSENEGNRRYVLPFVIPSAASISNLRYFIKR